jgi:hypothetical protein
MADNNGRLAPLRLNAAFATVTGTGPKTAQVFADWVQNVPPAEGAVRFSARASADVARVAWRVEGDAEPMLPGLGDWLNMFGLPDAEAQRFTKVTSVLEPTRLGGVVEFDDGLDAGWYLPLDASVYDTLAIEDEKRTETVHDLAAWCEKRGVERCSRLQRFVGRGQSEVWMPVPGSGEKAMKVALEAFDALGQSGPPAPARTALIEAAGNGVDVVGGLRATGIMSLGIHVRRPSTAQVLALARTATKRDERRLAAFEGALGVNGPAGAEYRVYSKRTELLLYYDVA